MRARLSFYVLLAALWLPAPSTAGELVFRNGDRLTGTLLSQFGGKLSFDSSVLGKVTVPADEIESLNL